MMLIEMIAWCHIPHICLPSEPQKRFRVPACSCNCQELPCSVCLLLAKSEGASFPTVSPTVTKALIVGLQLWKFAPKQ